MHFQFILESKEVIRYISLNSADEEIILAFLRTYSGIYDMPTAVNLSLIARKSQVEETQVEETLARLKEKGVVDYIAKHNDALLTFNEVREDERTINRVVKYLEAQNELKKQKLQEVIRYVKTADQCKSRMILAYFGEKNTVNCGICSFCSAVKQKTTTTISIRDLILESLTEKPLSSRELFKSLPYSEQVLILALKELLEDEKIKILPSNQYTIS
jgi:ATP-dependent DNA helicase RecQ